MIRRKFIKMTLISAAGTTLPFRFLNAVNIESSSPQYFTERSEATKGTNSLIPSSMITPIGEFYILQIRQAPHIKPDHWRLRISGLVKAARILSYAEFTQMDSVTTMRTLKCIGDLIGTEQMSNAMWTGVPLADVLQDAGVEKEAKVVVFRCADGYHTAVPLDRALREETLLVYKMNGEVLPQNHGFPVRLLNPGHYGTKNPKWIVDIILAEKHEGYWEKRGWDPIARVKLATLIGTPADGEKIRGGAMYTISGAAFDSGNHNGVRSVEVSLDSGNTWEEAKIWASDSQLAWYLWKYTWQAPKNSGEIEIYARSIANDGLIQRETGFDLEPAGSIGYHTVRAEIVE